jgi:hypothetical protein
MITSFEPIKRTNEHATNILSMMAFDHWQSIPQSLLIDDEESEFAFGDAVGELVAYSLVTK